MLSINYTCRFDYEWFSFQFAKGRSQNICDRGGIDFRQPVDEGPGASNEMAWNQELRTLDSHLCLSPAYCMIVNKSHSPRPHFQGSVSPPQPRERWSLALGHKLKFLKCIEWKELYVCLSEKIFLTTSYSGRYPLPFFIKHATIWSHVLFYLFVWGVSPLKRACRLLRVQVQWCMTPETWPQWWSGKREVESVGKCINYSLSEERGPPYSIPADGMSSCPQIFELSKRSQKFEV